MTRVLLALLCAALFSACGAASSTATSNSAQNTSAPAAAGSTPTAAQGGSAGHLVVTGSLSVSANETPNSANMCQAGSGGTVSAILVFDAYALQFDIPVGTSRFPSTPSPGAVAFFNGSDSTQEWSIGTARSATASGTATLSADGKSGSVDVDMLPDPPRPNPALKPIHVKGTFVCA
jgi:hypothetical protein